jgi:hypothetical protein
MDCLLVCGGVMKMGFIMAVQDFWDVLYNFFFFFVVLSWNVDIGRLVGAMLQKLKINGTTFGELSIFWFIMSGFGFSM